MKKSSPPPPDAPEVTSLNLDMCGFDLDSVEIEELERRFEMALALAPPDGAGVCRCPSLQTCGVYCAPPP